MCVAIYQKIGAKISLAMLDEGAFCNPDGAGYSFWDGNKVQIRRSLHWKDIRTMFQRDAAQYGPTSPFTIHFRIKSHGMVCKDNCHPFRMADGGSFIHNGIINIPGIPDEQSDTRWFVSQVLDRLPRGWQYDPIWPTIVQEAMGGGSKAVALWPDGAHTIFGESRGRWEKESGSYAKDKEDGDIWYSNNSCSLPTEWQLEQRRKAMENNKGGGNPKVAGLLSPGRTGMMGGAGTTNHPLPPYSRVLPLRREWQNPLPFDLPEDKFERTGPHSWRMREAAEVAREKLPDVDVVADRAWRDECFDDALCPSCIASFPSPEAARAHWVHCFSDQKTLSRNRRGLL